MIQRTFGKTGWRVGEIGVSLPSLHAEGSTTHIPDYNTHKVKVQLSHWSQLLALPGMAEAAKVAAGDAWLKRAKGET